MKIKQIVLLALAITFFASCKNESKEKDSTENNNVSADFNNMLDRYYEEGLILNPLSATFSGDTRYNNSFPNFLSEEYIAGLTRYYTSFKAEASKFDDATLNETEKMSKD